MDMPAPSMMGSYMVVVTPDEIYGILEDVHNRGHAGSRALWHKVFQQIKITSGFLWAPVGTHIIRWIWCSYMDLQNGT